MAAPYIAEIHVALGHTEQALSWLERGVEKRSGAMPALRVNPRLDPLGVHPRFRARGADLGLIRCAGADS